MRTARTLPFQIQENQASPYEPETWLALSGHKYATLADAEDSMLDLITANTQPGKYRVYCAPVDVARAMYEAHVAIRQVKEALDSVTSDILKAERGREALEERVRRPPHSG